MQPAEACSLDYSVWQKYYHFLHVPGSEKVSEALASLMKLMNLFEGRFI
jgi:hypothetical protein